MIQFLCSFLYKALQIYLIYALIVVPVTGVYQEHKVSAPKEVPSLKFIGIVKAYLLFLFWVTFSLLGTLVLVPKYIINGCSSESVEHTVNCLVERITGIILTGMFVGPVQVRGRHNIPSQNRNDGQNGNGNKSGCIYIANHSSTIDASVVYFLFQKFKWIAKKSILYMPGVGAVMVMGGHIILDRKSKQSRNKLYERSHEMLQSGENIFLFPQGTRRLSEWLPFRDGAFNLALEGGYTIVPISIELPRGHWNSWYPLNLMWKKKNDPVVITVHPAIKVKKMEGNEVNVEDRTKLKSKSEEIILSSLPHFRKLIEKHNLK